VLPAYATFHADVGEQIWYPDSAVASHMMLDEGNLLSKTHYSGSGLVKVGNGTLLSISSIGNLKLGTPSRPLRLNSVVHVSQLRYSLMSFKQMCRDNNRIVICNDSCVRFKDNMSGEVLLQTLSVGNVYHIRVASGHISVNIVVRESGDSWHPHLVHYGAYVLNSLSKFNLI